MIREEHHNILSIVASRMISRIGDIMFDFDNNTFLAGLNPTSLSVVSIYQSLESMIG
ncbi:macrolide ABC transporter permease, partial [Streptococcus pneumoniae]|nr:macrolide ABC transporter permease [Streptococcus pneumoniae]